MKQKIIIVLFVFIIIGVGCLNVLFPSPRLISELENRTLAVIPELNKEEFFTGEFFSGIESYYSDHFFKRELFVMFSQRVNEFKGLVGKDSVELITTLGRDESATSDESIADGLNVEESDRSHEAEMVSEKGILLEYQKKDRIVSANDLNQKVRNLAKEEIAFSTTLEPAQLDTVDNDAVLEQLELTDDGDFSGGMMNEFLVVNDSSYEIFTYSETSCAFYAESINDFAAQLDESDKVYSIVAPSHIEFIESEKYRSMAESQADATNFINSGFNGQVTPVNIYNSLGEHSDEYIYFRSDHHWTALGAYYAYTAFAKTIGDKPYELDAFEKVDIEGFLGTLYNATYSRAVKANPDTVSVYKPFVESTYTIYTKGNQKLNYDVINMYWKKKPNKYMVFLSGDNPLSIIDTELDNGKKIMVLKDSYGNAFIPYLMNHYDEIYIIDPRHYDAGAITLAKENDIHEFLFINSAIVVAGHTSFAKKIYKVSY